MSAGIYELDKGYVHGTTWHGLEQYKQLNSAVSEQQAAEVFDYPLIKCQLFDEDMAPVNGAYCIKRSDTNTVLVPTVGERFEVLSNLHLLNYISENFLAKFSDLEIESVGTLFNGKIAFLNLKIGELQIKGDESPQLNRLMYYNPLGAGGYGVLSHSVRVVCNNTLKASVAQGAANQTIKRISHTRTAAERINNHMEEIAEVKMGLKKFEEQLNHLTTLDVDSKFVEAFSEFVFPSEKDSGRGYTMAATNRNTFMNSFETLEFMNNATRWTRYGVLQAFTYTLDNGKVRKNDAQKRAWDGLTGYRSDRKAKAFDYLLTV